MDDAPRDPRRPDAPRPDGDDQTAPIGAVPPQDPARTGAPARPAAAPDPTRSLPVQPAPVAGTAGGTAAAPGRWDRLRERAWSLRAVLAVALASVLLGGAGGAALASAAGGEDAGRGGPGGRHGFNGGPPGFGRQGGPNQQGQQGGFGQQGQQGQQGGFGQQGQQGGSGQQGQVPQQRTP